MAGSKLPAAEDRMSKKNTRGIEGLTEVHIRILGVKRWGHPRSERPTGA